MSKDVDGVQGLRRIVEKVQKEEERRLQDKWYASKTNSQVHVICVTISKGKIISVGRALSTQFVVVSRCQRCSSTCYLRKSWEIAKRRSSDSAALLVVAERLFGRGTVFSVANVA